MKTELQKHLATVAPSVAIETLWEHDEDARFSSLTGPGDCFENEDPDDWQAWQSEVRASAIVRGEMLSDSDYMGGTWERYGDNPAESNPEISGYENQMTVSALKYLREQVAGGKTPVSLIQEIERAIAECHHIARASYEKQRAEIEARKASTV